MKKIFAGLLCIMMIVTAGCGEKVVTDETSPASESVEVTEPVGPVDSDWFNDAVFVGDSVTLRLSYYSESDDAPLGDAQFFCAGSLGYTSALWDIDRKDAVHPYYKGQVQLCENCAELTGATKVFIMLGMNDLSIYGVEGTMESASELINRIRTNSPKTKIYMQSVTPILKGHEIGDLNNENIRALNVELEKFAVKHGYKYLDIYDLVADKEGYLKADYCGDEGAQGIHFTAAACGIWADYLKEHVRD